MLVLVLIQEKIYLIVLRVVCRATVYKSLQSKRGWTYVKQSLSQKELLGRATAKYAANIHLAEGYLASRGITREVARLARFGVVSEPEVGHEAFIGRLSIPYITKTGVVDLRFRSLNPAVEPKYMGMTGVETKMYNVTDIDRAGDWIGVCLNDIRNV